MCRVLAFVARQPANAFAGPMSVHRSAARPMPEMAGEQPLASADYTVENKGTLLLLRSSNGRAYDWLVTHTEASCGGGFQAVKQGGIGGALPLDDGSGCGDCTVSGSEAFDLGPCGVETLA